MRPRRITLSRARGWRMPAGAIKCDRSTVLGNPWTAGEAGEGGSYRLRRGEAPLAFGRPLSVEEAVGLHRAWLLGELGCTGGAMVSHPRFGLVQAPHGHAVAIAELARIRGCDLACWCPQQRAGEGAEIVHCHADTLLVLANAGDDGGWAEARRWWRASVPLKSRMGGEMAA